MAKTQKVQEKKTGASSGSEKIMEESGAVPAVVEATIGRTGTKGELTQVKVRILQGKNVGKQMRRNVRGPVKKGAQRLFKSLGMLSIIVLQSVERILKWEEITERLSGLRRIRKVKK
jgi:small subunit ribosomal protein S28e